jgi:DNA-binding GntR family transcriptional regulator
MHLMSATTTITKQKRVYQTLRERILSGVYGPGFRVVIAALAEEFSVSRSTAA